MPNALLASDLPPPRCRTPAWAACRLALASMVFAVAPLQAGEDPAAHIRFIEEPSGTCIARGGVQILLKSQHPTRGIRVWLDRTLGGNGTGDRS